MRSTWGNIIIMAVLLLAACGTGNRLDDEEDGGGNYLPTVNEVDSGRIELNENGAFPGAGQDLVLTDATSLTSIRLPDLTVVSCPDDYYDEDNDGVLDFIVLTIRPLSAHAAACTTARDGSGATVSPSLFDKVGGAGFEPHAAGFSPRATLTLGVSSASQKTVGQTVDLYKFTSNYQVSRLPAADIGTGSGVWDYIESVTLTEQDGYLVATFDVTEFGEYAVVTDVIHNQGGGSSV